MDGNHSPNETGADTASHDGRALMLRLFDRLDLPVILAGILILGLLIAFLVLVPGRRGEDKTPAGAGGIDRQLERIAGQLEAIEAKIAAVEQQTQVLGNMARQLATMEATLSLRLDSIAHRLDLLGEPQAWQEETRRGHSGKVDASVTAVPVATAEAGGGPAARPPAPGPEPDRWHAVRSGETLYSISRRYDISVEALRKLNGLKPEDAIYPGQRLTIAAQ